MFRSASVFQCAAVPFEQWEERLALHKCPDLGALDQQAVGWEMWEKSEQWFLSINGLYLIQSARKLRKIPQALLAERLSAELASMPGEVNAYEKRQIKNRLIDALLPEVLPEKYLVPVLFDPENELLIIGSQSGVVIDNILRLLRDTFPGIQLKASWGKDAQRHAIRQGWNKDKWPVDSQVVGDMILVHNSGQHQKIRLSGVSDLTVVNDCIIHGYAIVGLRLELSSGLSCFVAPTGHFQNMRYAKVEDEDKDNMHGIDVLSILELRAWVQRFRGWVNESA